MNKTRLLLPILIFILLVSTVYCQGIDKVFEKDSCIYSSQEDKADIKLTNSGKDRSPVLSPDGKKIVFIRKSKEKAYDPTEGVLPRDAFADQLWIIDVDGSNEKMLVQDKNPDISDVFSWRGEDVVGFIKDESLQFSPDGKTVYFLTPAWVTSSALRAVNIDGSSSRFIAGGDNLKVIDKGGYKGNLIITQHRYYITGGSYDWYYVFTPEGKEIGPLGKDLDNVNWDFLYSDSIGSGDARGEK